MTQRQILLDEIKKAPDNIFQEVFDFYQFLKIKSNKKISDILIAGESSLKKDWLKEDKDKAWQDLKKNHAKARSPRMDKCRGATMARSAQRR